ncbi:MAG: phage major capsid protein [Oscillospiraceae bacterium]
MAYNFNEIALEKGMYGVSGKSFTEVLESMDPSESYKGGALEGLDAYQRQLKRFDIKVRGTGSDPVEKFFSTAASSVLFPEYVSRSVKAGMEEGNILPSITATVTNFEGMDYRSIYSEAGRDEKSLRRVEEGAIIPQTQVKASDHTIKLHKRGRMLVASYEAIRYQRLDLFSVMLRQIGSQIMRMHLDDAIDVIKSGDGNTNAAESFTIGDAVINGTAGTLTYDALLKFWSRFDPYTLNTLLVAPDAMLKLLSLPVFQDAAAGLNFQGTGDLVNPLGAKLIKSAAVAPGTIIGLDRSYALEMIQSGDVSVEYDRLIDRQLERAAITSISGFAKLYTDASKILAIGG